MVIIYEKRVISRDRKKKKFIGQSGDEPAQKKIRTEDGTWLPASYKTGRYELWKKNQKIAFQKEDDGEMEETAPARGKFTHKRGQQSKVSHFL